MGLVTPSINETPSTEEVPKAEDKPIEELSNAQLD